MTIWDDINKAYNGFILKQKVLLKQQMMSWTSILTIFLVVGTAIYFQVDEDTFKSEPEVPGFIVGVKEIPKKKVIQNVGELNVTSIINNEVISVRRIEEGDPILDLVEALKRM